MLPEERVFCISAPLSTPVFCETDLNIKLVFTSFKIKNMLSFKDRIPDALKSMVVYQFTCAGCNSCYIGETSRHCSTRIKEHTVSDKNSHIFKHFPQFPSCRGMYTPLVFASWTQLTKGSFFDT